MHHGLFIDVGALHTINEFESFGAPGIGIQFGLGWDTAGNWIISLDGAYWQYSLDTETGQLAFMPLGLRLEYAKTFKDSVTVRGGLAGGMYLFMLSGNGSGMSYSPFAGPRFFIEYEIPLQFFRHRSFSVFGGGGLDVIVETRSTYFIPILELGLRIRPMILQAPVVRIYN
ncbi:MAG: hypothetical protein LBC77_04965 [Spirochaetaceae bacterium]|nr:hypothetical protein [Spirochaetaceae bacterium]